MDYITLPSGRNIPIPEEHEIWKNDKYQVHKRSFDEGLIWLSIKRLDREPIHDWRELQEIKNQIIGPEEEAIEIYPAESRLVDMSNQFHLWCVPGKKFTDDIGFNEGRKIMTPEEAEVMGARQRPFNN